jgi:hypothetical protein
MRIGRICRCEALILLTLASSAIHAADILQQLPRDSLGFVVVHRVSAVDARVRSMSTQLRHNAFSPLGFLKTVTGVQDGLNLDGDCLFAIYPDSHPDANAQKPKLRYGIWLPVADYGRFMQSMGATPREGISVVTVAGEELLVARRDDWALVMDPDQRERMTGLLATPPSGPPVPTNWKKWVDSNDLAVVALAPGIGQILFWADFTYHGDKSTNESSDDLFGARSSSGPRLSLAARRVNRLTSRRIDEIFSSEFGKWSDASPEFVRACQQAELAGIGLRFDSSDNLIAGLRVKFKESPKAESKADVAVLPYDLYANGPFVTRAAGRLPPKLATAITSALLRRYAIDLKDQENTELDEESLKQVTAAAEQAAAVVRSAELLSLSGTPSDPVYSNKFIALRVSSAKQFSERATEAVRLWNKANRDADGEMKMIFEIEETKLGNRTGTQFVLDIVPLLGINPLPPEARLALVKLFGPGAKLRYWVVPADDNTVLVAVATEDQLNGILKNFDRNEPIAWKQKEIGDTNKLLTAESDWRGFFDPHRYYERLGRQQAAQTSVPVVGGPLVRPFPDCPPAGIAAGFRDNELWIDAAVLAPTIKTACSYIADSFSVRRRPTRAPRLQALPRKKN